MLLLWQQPMSFPVCTIQCPAITPREWVPNKPCPPMVSPSIYLSPQTFLTLVYIRHSEGVSTLTALIESQASEIIIDQIIVEKSQVLPSISPEPTSHSGSWWGPHSRRINNTLHRTSSASSQFQHSWDHLPSGDNDVQVSHCPQLCLDANTCSPYYHLLDRETIISWSSVSYNLSPCAHTNVRLESPDFSC